MLLTDLPEDILNIIFPYLNAHDFLSLTCSTKLFLAYRQDPTFWRILTQSTFRLPPQPFLQADGERWKWLYQHLLTKTRMFSWGQNERGELGHSYPTRDELDNGSPDQTWQRWEENRTVGWPSELNGANEVGVIADLQCGGWSTTLLNSIGQIYVVGVLHGQRQTNVTPKLEALSFFPAFPPTTKDRYEPSTAIRQYSVGRSHILGLSDSGKVWFWHDFRQAAVQMKSLHVDFVENISDSNRGGVRRVVAGWDRSSIYVNGTGIVFWPITDAAPSARPAIPGGLRTIPRVGPPQLMVNDRDTLLLDTMTIPGTSYHRKLSKEYSELALDMSIGEVTNHIVLEGYIVFTTDMNRIFAYPTDLGPESYYGRGTAPAELTTFYQSLDEEPDFQISDLQGSFRSFAVFAKSGAVLTASRWFLDAFCILALSTSETLPSPDRIPALQNSSIISIAFGDYHYHALHANGKISSYGTEPQSRGAFGLGKGKLAKLRGIRQQGRDGKLELAHISRWSDGRKTVWFEEEKKMWLQDMVRKADEGEAHGQGIGDHSDSQIEVLGEWFEREGREWSRGPHPYTHSTHEAIEQTESEDEGAYFALKVSAAGWHSGALVLVDEAKAARVKQKYVVKLPPKHPSLATTISQPPGILQQMTNAVSGFARWLSGPQALESSIARSLPGPPQATQNQVEPSENENAYIWHDRPFPRLRNVTGELMPGDGPAAEWRGEEPPFPTSDEAEA